MDSSTQSCKVVVVEADTGVVVREGRTDHPDGTSIDPSQWWSALRQGLTEAGGLADVAAISVAGQQHGMVALDRDGRVIRDALLWHDTRSAAAARDLVAELGPQRWAQSTGSVPVASYTVTKLRWLRDAEPENAARVAAVALPHDWLTWRLAGYGPRGESPYGPDLDALATDRSDASGTGYFNPDTNTYERDLLVTALGHDCILPRVVAPNERVAVVHPTFAGGATEVAIGPGAGDNAGAALGLGMVAGDVAVSIGTSGVVSAIADLPSRDAAGLVSGFADATGRYLPLACTLNGSRILDAARAVLGVSYDELDRLALSAPSGAEGLVLVPYLEGERTPNLPEATGSLLGLRLANHTPAHLARAYVEGLLCGLADGLAAIEAQGLRPERVVLIGGGAKSAAVRAIAPGIFGVEVAVPAPGEYVALGAARQAAWVSRGSSAPPVWQHTTVSESAAAPVEVAVRERYAQAKTLFLPA